MRSLSTLNKALLHKWIWQLKVGPFGGKLLAPSLVQKKGVVLPSYKGGS